MAIDHLGRATKIQVNALGAQCGQAGSVLGHAHRVRAQQLRTHRHTGEGAATIEQFRT